MPGRGLTIMLSCLLVTASTASAQRRVQVQPDVDSHLPGVRSPIMPLAQDEQASARYAPMILAGIGAAAAGLVGGALAGARIERAIHTCSCDDPGLFGAIIGAAAGPALLTPIAVHVAGGGRGSLATSYGRAAAIGAGGFVSLFAFGAPGLVVLTVVAPAAQVYSAVRAQTMP